MLSTVMNCSGLCLDITIVFRHTSPTTAVSPTHSQTPYWPGHSYILSLTLCAKPNQTTLFTDMWNKQLFNYKNTSFYFLSNVLLLQIICKNKGLLRQHSETWNRNAMAVDAPDLYYKKVMCWEICCLVGHCSTLLKRITSRKRFKKKYLSLCGKV